jgi:hypothetical protein
MQIAALQVAIDHISFYLIGMPEYLSVKIDVVGYLTLPAAPSLLVNSFW